MVRPPPGTPHAILIVEGSCLTQTASVATPRVPAQGRPIRAAVPAKLRMVRARGMRGQCACLMRAGGAGFFARIELLTGNRRARMSHPSRTPTSATDFGWERRIDVDAWLACVPTLTTAAVAIYRVLGFGDMDPRRYLYGHFLLLSWHTRRLVEIDVIGRYVRRTTSI